MTKHTIEDLERMYKLPDNKAEGESMLPAKGFKFKVGDKVTHKAFGYNAMIIRTLIIEDEDSKDYYYDIGVWESMPPTEGQNIPENQLKAGFRPIPIE